MKKFALTSALGAMFCCSLLAGGCATEQPHSLTGYENSKYHPTYAERLPYLNEKGQFQMAEAHHDHPDWEVNWGV